MNCVVFPLGEAFRQWRWGMCLYKSAYFSFHHFHLLCHSLLWLHCQPHGGSPVPCVMSELYAKVWQLSGIQKRMSSELCQHLSIIVNCIPKFPKHGPVWDAGISHFSKRILWIYHDSSDRLEQNRDCPRCLPNAASQLRELQGANVIAQMPTCMTMNPGPCPTTAWDWGKGWGSNPCVKYCILSSL